MSSRIVVAVLLTLLCSVFLYGQFEGVIDMKVASNVDGKMQTMTYSMYVKTDLLAADMKPTAPGEEGGKFIFRGDKKVLWMVNDKEKMYLEFPLNEMKDAAKDKQEKKVDVKKTGKKETILGYECEEWQIKEGDEMTSLWVTPKLVGIYENLTKSLSGMGGGKGEQAGWQTELEKIKGFPMKVAEYKDGKIEQTQEVTKVEQKSVPASMFEAPAGYKKQSMGDMMQDMMKMMQEKMKDKKEKEE